MQRDISRDVSKWRENGKRKVNRKSEREIHHIDANGLVCQHRNTLNYGYKHSVQYV